MCVCVCRGHISSVYKHTVYTLTQSPKAHKSLLKGKNKRMCSGLVVGAVYLDGKGLPKVPVGLWGT